MADQNDPATDPVNELAENLQAQQEPTPQGDPACLDDMSMLSQGSIADPLCLDEQSATTASNGDAPVESQETPSADGNDNNEQPTLIEQLLADKDKRSKPKPPSFRPGAKDESETLGPVTEAEKQILEQAEIEPEQSAQTDEPEPVQQPSGLIIQPPSGKAVGPQNEQPEFEPVAEEPQPEPVAEEPETEPVAEEPESEPVAEEPEPEPVADEPEPAPVAAVDQAPPEAPPVAAESQPEQEPVCAPQWTQAPQPEADMRPWYKKRARLLAGVAALALVVYVVPMFVDLPDFGSADQVNQTNPRLDAVKEAREVALKLSRLNAQKQQQMMRAARAAEEGRDFQPDPKIDAEIKRLSQRASQLALQANPNTPAEAKKAIQLAQQQKARARQAQAQAESRQQEQLALAETARQSAPAQQAPPQPQQAKQQPAQTAPTVPDLLKQVQLTNILIASDPAASSASINDQTLQLGQTSREGIRLLRVRSDNVIVRFQGQLFRLRLTPSGQ